MKNYLALIRCLRDRNVGGVVLLVDDGPPPAPDFREMEKKVDSYPSEWPETFEFSDAKQEARARRAREVRRQRRLNSRRRGR